MTTILLVCPIFADEVRRALRTAGHEEVEVRALAGGPEATSCTPLRRHGAGQHVLLVGPCVHGAEGIAEAEATTKHVRERLAQSQMTFELVASIDRYERLEDAIDAVESTLGGLFAATVEVALTGDEPAWISQTGPTAKMTSTRRVSRSDQTGFEIPIEVSTGCVGTLRASNVALPERLSDYLSLALSLAPMLGLAIERHRNRTRTERRRRLNRTVFNAVQEGIVVTDRDATILTVNPAFERLTGYSANEVVGQNPRLLQSGRHDAAFYREMWQALADVGAWQGELFNRRRDGTIYRQRLQINAVRDERGRVVSYVGTMEDITERYLTQAALQHRATHDPLTDLGNRDWLSAKLAWALGEADENKRHVGVIFIDLDRFKAINDTYGHEGGDRVLVEIARRLTAAVRRGDAVARVGGDEFVVVAAELAEPADAVRVADTILTSLRQPIALGQGELQATVSVGVAVYPEDAGAADELMRAADAAMYVAKEAGRNRVARHGDR